MMPTTFSEIAEIVKLLDASSCEDVTLEIGDVHIALRRAGSSRVPSAAARAERLPHQGPKAEPTGTSPVIADADGTAPLRATVAPSPPGTESAIDVRSPMVGTFYRAPSPNAPPFVEVGATVAAGDALGLIEVMKLFTTITAPGAGRVASIPVANAEMVATGELLFRIDPD
jgi:acetyl-CoA carboxylase biotin carboxyl carrier protein